MKNPPKKLSVAMRLALADLAKVERSKDYEIDKTTIKRLKFKVNTLTQVNKHLELRIKVLETTNERYATALIRIKEDASADPTLTAEIALLTLDDL